MKVRITGLPSTKKVRITGVPKAQMGMQGHPNVEAEGGEVYQDVNGDFNKIDDNAPSHEQGGVKLAGVHRVLEDTSTDRKDKHSKMLKMSPKEIETIFGTKVKSPVSHAKAFELVKKDYQKQIDKYNRHLKYTNEEDDMDKFSVNSAKLNFYNKDAVPTDDDIFNTLFEHQEAIKEVHNIPDSGKHKYGGYKFNYKAQFGAGPKAGTPEGEFTTTGLDVNENPNVTLDDYKKAWGDVGVDLSGYKTTQEAQRATYDWLAKNNPDVLRDMWKRTGLTNFGRKNLDKLQKLGIDVAANPKDKFKRMDVVDWDKLTPKQLEGLNDVAYSDNNFRIRTLIPTKQTTTEGQPAPVGQPTQQPTSPVAPVKDNTQGNGLFRPNFKKQPTNQFYEPTRWYDLAPGVAELVDSMSRDPELYNPVQIHQLKYKLLNPTAAVQANQGDYNAALKSLQNQNLGSGVAAANVANVASQKYKANNQILAEYENQNAQIQNREIDYNTQARDRQSMADAGSRATYYSNVLKARDAQRLQKLQAIQDLSRVQQLKARQNRSGNLVLKMTPAFDENGNYNGYQYVPTLPEDIGYNFQPTTPQTGKRSTGRTSQTTTYKIGDRTIKTTNTEPEQ